MLGFFLRPFRIAWARRDTIAESPVVTPMETNAAITVFDDTNETEVSMMAEVDNALPISLISKATIDRLRVSYEPSHHEPVTDSKKKTHHPIGQKKLRWHKIGKPKSHPHVFHIVDGLTPSVILGATAVPKAKENDVGTLGLSKQTEGKDAFIIVT